MKENVAIIGAGIVGLAHAWSAAERGHKVTVYERSGRASGASIRNFGMIWPIGQPEAFQPVAIESRRRWMTLAGESSIWISPCGSLHLAHQPDEWDVLQEFFAQQSHTELGTHLRLLTPKEALARCAGIEPKNFLGALSSDLENLC